MKKVSLEVFFDGECPLCRREIDWLRKRDIDGKVRFTDLADPGFIAAGLGRTRADLMARIHGRLEGGLWIEGIDLFIELYERCRLPLLARLLRMPLLRPLFDVSYRFFARHRLSLTGRRRCGAACRLGGTPS